MITVRSLLAKKPDCLWTINQGATAYEALQVMAVRDVGALLVLNNEGRLSGVFSERDYARKVILRGKSSKETLVSDLMTHAVYYVGPDNTINDCMALMTAKHIRHIPVIEDGSLIGIVTIGDVVNAVISEQEITIRDLETYITGGSYEFETVHASTC